MRLQDHTKLVVCLSVLVLLAVATPSYALRVGWNVDIHMNKHWYPVGDPNRGGINDRANDFHIWGILESGDPSGANPPTFTSEVNFQTTGPGGIPPWLPVQNGIRFQTFTPQIGNPVNRPLPVLYPGPNPPTAPFYYFDGNWTNPTQGLPFCTWMHFGLEFDETCHNIGYWLQATWTKNGVDPEGSPLYGFEVRDGYPVAERQKITIQNSSGVETNPQGMDLMILSKEEGAAFPLEDLNTSFFDMHPEWNMRWVHVPTSMIPTTLVGDGGINSFFDVYFDQVPGLGVLPPEGVVLARQLSTYTEGTDPTFWQYELHGAHTPEPMTLTILLAGFGALVAARRRK